MGTIEVLLDSENTLINVGKKSFKIGEPEEVKFEISGRHLFILYNQPTIPEPIQKQLLRFSETIRVITTRDREFPPYKCNVYDAWIPLEYNLIIKSKSLDKT